MDDASRRLAAARRAEVLSHVRNKQNRSRLDTAPALPGGSLVCERRDWLERQVEPRYILVLHPDDAIAMLPPLRESALALEASSVLAGIRVAALLQVLPGECPSHHDTVLHKVSMAP